MESIYWNAIRRPFSAFINWTTQKRQTNLETILLSEAIKWLNIAPEWLQHRLLWAIQHLQNIPLFTCSSSILQYIADFNFSFGILRHSCMKRFNLVKKVSAEYMWAKLDISSRKAKTLGVTWRTIKGLEFTSKTSMKLNDIWLVLARRPMGRLRRVEYSTVCVKFHFNGASFSFFSKVWHIPLQSSKSKQSPVLIVLDFLSFFCRLLWAVAEMEIKCVTSIFLFNVLMFAWGTLVSLVVPPVPLPCMILAVLSMHPAPFSC